MANIRDVANALGVSPASVSRALNGKTKVNPELRRRIQEKAREMDYRIIPRGAPRTIAVILPALETGTLGIYTLHILGALREELARAGRPLLILSSNDLALLSEHQIGGAISIAYRSAVENRLPYFKGIPLVCLNTPGRVIEQVYTVKCDEEQGIGLAVRHLVRYGHRRIGFLKSAGEIHNDAENERLAAFRKFTAQLDGAAVEEYTQFHEGVGLLLKKQVTAIIAADGENASGLIYRSLDLYGRNVPGDISVIGWEAPDFANALTPAQTTLSQNFVEIARNAVALLEKLMRGETVTRNILLTYKLLERDSVAPARHAGQLPSDSER